MVITLQEINTYFVQSDIASISVFEIRNVSRCTVQRYNEKVVDSLEGKSYAGEILRSGLIGALKGKFCNRVLLCSRGNFDCELPTFNQSLEPTSKGNIIPSIIGCCPGFESCKTHSKDIILPV
jgi:hypothetical protein